jgi:ATP-binding cassette subfamily C (CFTR/MRP) protein 1
VIVVISLVTPYFTVCLIPLIIFYKIQQHKFTLTYRELKRLDSVNRSPLYALLGETLDGVSTIRSFRAEHTFLRQMINMLDVQQNAYFLTCTAQCWLAVRLELIGTLIISLACLFAVLEHNKYGGDEAFASLAGLSISFALSVTQALNWSVRMSSDLEAQMISVERVRQYCHLTTEAPHHLEEDCNIPGNWPQNGSIKFSSVMLRYRKGLPLVLKGLDIFIPSKSKVCVVIFPYSTYCMYNV